MLLELLTTYVLTKSITPNLTRRQLPVPPALGLVQIQEAQDPRSRKLSALFRKYKSPLENEIKVFLEVADQQKIDYRILPSIAIVESTACKHTPKHAKYNCFGWGCSTGSKCTKFDSYADAIQTVGRGIANNRAYKRFQQTGSIEALANVYNGGDKKAWAVKVKGLMNSI